MVKYLGYSIRMIHDYTDRVEHRDDTSHATWTNSGLGDFRAQFVSKWDAAHLATITSLIGTLMLLLLIMKMVQ